MPMCRGQPLLVAMPPLPFQPNPDIPESSVRAWDELADLSGTLPTQCPAWAVAAMATLPGVPQLHALGENGGCDAIAPLARRSGTLEPVASCVVGEPADLLARTPEE